MKNRYEMVHIKMQRINARGLYNLAQQRKMELEKRDDAHDNRHLHYVLANLKDMMDALEVGIDDDNCSMCSSKGEWTERTVDDGIHSEEVCIIKCVWCEGTGKTPKEVWKFEDKMAKIQKRIRPINKAP